MGFWTSKEKRTDITVNIGPWYDLHSHFLPGIDDGCRTVDETLELLRFSFKQGVRGMIATPHYYPEESIADFLGRRQEAAKRLQTALELSAGQPVRPEACPQYGIPAWCLGAEAAYYEGLVRSEDIEKLCLGKSRYLLLELPFERWSSGVIRDIHTLGNLYNITPVIAHLERYLDIQSKDMLEELYAADVLIQMNGGFILRKTRNALKRVRGGLVRVLGSDAHNMEYRRPNLCEAVQILYKESLSAEAEEIRRQNERIFRSAMGE